MQWSVCTGRTGGQTQRHVLIQSEHDPLFVSSTEECD